MCNTISWFQLQILLLTTIIGIIEHYRRQKHPRRPELLREKGEYGLALFTMDILSWDNGHCQRTMHVLTCPELQHTPTISPRRHDFLHVSIERIGKVLLFLPDDRGRVHHRLGIPGFDRCTCSFCLMFEFMTKYTQFKIIMDNQLTNTWAFTTKKCLTMNFKNWWQRL